MNLQGDAQAAAGLLFLGAVVAVGFAIGLVVGLWL